MEYESIAPNPHFGYIVQCLHNGENTVKNVVNVGGHHCIAFKLFIRI